jgi:hypothetical protein
MNNQIDRLKSRNQRAHRKTQFNRFQFDCMVHSQSDFKISLHHEKNNVSRIRKKTFYLQFCMGTLEGNEFAG